MLYYQLSFFRNIFVNFPERHRAMLWTRFTLVAMLFGVILCNRFVDNRLIDFSAPYAAAVKNSDAQKVAILESLSNVNFLSKNPSEHHSEPYENNYPYHQITNHNENLQSNHDDYSGSGSEAHEAMKGKNEPNQEKEDIFDSRTDVFSANEDNSAFGLNDFNYIAHEKNADSLRSGSLIYSGLDDALDNEVRALSAIDTDNVAYFYEDLLPDLKNTDVKRGTSVSTIGCDCKIKNDLLDLGQKHFPRYLLNAVCQSSDVREPRCWRGICKPLEYKVKVLTFRTVKDQKDPALAWLPDDLRQLWKFKTVTVAAGCFCAVG